MKVLGVSGMPGAGKSIVSRMAADMGFGVVRMGDVIREEAHKRNHPSGKVAVDLRREFGEYIVADRSVDKIKKMYRDDSPFYIIEGIRSPHEVEIFRKNFPNFKVIAVNSTPKTRFQRLKNRRRDDDFIEQKAFFKRDKRELNFGIGDVIATADYMFVNEGSLKKLKRLVRSILKNEMQNKS